MSVVRSKRAGKNNYRKSLQSTQSIKKAEELSYALYQCGFDVKVSAKGIRTLKVDKLVFAESNGHECDDQNDPQCGFGNPLNIRTATGKSPARGPLKTVATPKRRSKMRHALSLSITNRNKLRISDHFKFEVILKSILPDPS